MNSTDAVFLVDTGADTRRVVLSDYLDTQAAEAAHTEANAWIKSLRNAQVQGRSFRDRFSYRGDSLWWFAELYLHKRGVIDTILSTILSLEALVERERPVELTLVEGDRIVRGLASQMARRRGVAYRGPGGFGRGATRARVSTGIRSALYAMSAMAACLRPGARAQMAGTPAGVTAFVHSAFWRSENRAGLVDEECYIGPVLAELKTRLPAGDLALVGVGPRTNFRARTWRHRFAEFIDPHARAMPLTPVGTCTSWRAVRSSLEIWRERSAIRNALLASADLEAAAVIHGCDAWPIVREELAAVALLQFPWSAHAMDEAAAALDALKPRVVVTYAEAGGWGRALVLEARRRQIPSVGLQHGFIYRHWLNYQHEPDEMEPSAEKPSDRGFPRPDITLVFDQHAANDLYGTGCFPRNAVTVTGSPRLDTLVRTVRQLTPEEIAATRLAAGVQPEQHLVVVASKFTQIGNVFRDFAEAVGSMSDVRVIVKSHPAETGKPYARVAAPVANIAIAPAGASLAVLLASARLVVTVNSTAAIDAMVLGVPALVLALPNNLSPFVDAGAMAGARTPEEIAAQLRLLLYDEKRRARLAGASLGFMTRYGIGSDGNAARRSADAILSMMG